MRIELSKRQIAAVRRAIRDSVVYWLEDAARYNGSPYPEDSADAHVSRQKAERARDLLFLFPRNPK